MSTAKPKPTYAQALALQKAQDASRAARRRRRDEQGEVIPPTHEQDEEYAAAITAYDTAKTDKERLAAFTILNDLRKRP